MSKEKVLTLTARILTTSLGSVLATFALGIFGNPILSKLEPILWMELTGHSGPSDGTIVVIFFISFILLWIISGRGK